MPARAPSRTSTTSIAADAEARRRAAEAVASSASAHDWLLAFFGLLALIILHEAGHFIAAKATGMRVERFFLFFPPTICSFKRGETEYGIGAIPLGGFVKITGMNPEEELPPEVAPRGYYHQPVWKRIVVIGAGPLVNIVIAFLMLFALAFGAARADIESGARCARRLRPRAGSSRATESSPLTGAPATSSIFSAGSSSHKCAGRPTDGCLAATPGRLRVDRDGRQLTLTHSATVRRRAQADEGGFLLRHAAARPDAPGGCESSR